VVLAVLSTVVLLLWVNPLSAALSLTANAFYVFGYTMLLKRRTTQNIVWGGLAGCFPALIGWTAVTGELSWVPVVLFAVVFFWTPPHTWALALRYREDYANVDVPMLPVVAPAREVGRQVVIYSWVMVAVSLALWPVAGTGLVYPVSAAVLGAVFLLEAHRMYGRARGTEDLTSIQPMRLFHASNLYLSLLFVAVALDPLLTR
jgi:protoheme IX farnesyltransferase